MSALRTLVSRELVAADLLLSDEQHGRLQRDAMAAGRRALSGALPGFGSQTDCLARSLGLAHPALQRILGLGWQQAYGLAALAHAPPRARLEAARLGGIFNLGISTFDHLCDTDPERGALLDARVTPEFLRAQLRGHEPAARPSGDPAVDLLVSLIVRFFAGAVGLGGATVERDAFAHLIRDMHGGERLTIMVGLDDGPPTGQVWEGLRRKSALPMQTMGVLALLAHPSATQQRRATVQRAATLAGDALWLIDDLVDVRADWDARRWSRPLWLLARARREAPADADAAIGLLLETGIASAEARRLAARLDRLRRLPGAPDRAFLRPVLTAVRGWLDDLHD